MNFNKWLDTLIEEKNINTDQIIEVDGDFGVNMIPVAIVLNAIKAAPQQERAQIKTILVKIDFANGDVLHFIRHLAKALAI